MKKSDRFLKTAVLGVLAAFLFPALIHAALLTDDDIPVIGEETEQTAVEDAEAAQTEKTGKKTTKKSTASDNKTYTITYTVIPASVRKTQKDNVDWKSNPVTYTKADAFLLKHPTLEGYVFKGWFSDKAGKVPCGRRIKKGTTGNKRYYVRFEPAVYTIRFDGNGIMEAPDPITCVYGKTYKLPGCKEAGFTGWNTKARGTGTRYQAKEKVKNLTAKNGKTITLYADGLSGSNNIEKLFRYFKRRGYTRQAAAAIAGNLMWESGGGYQDIKLNAVELATGRGVGMVQWTDTKGCPRRTNFINYCKKHGYGWPNENLQLQIDFLEAELRGDYGKIWFFSPAMGYSTNYRRTLDQFKKCTNVQQAVGIFCACFERPYLRHAHLISRVQYANYVLKNFK